MWETAFEPSMIGDSVIVIHCPDGSLVQDLMEILAAHGVKWCTGESPATSENYWSEQKGDTVYYIDERKSMTYGSKMYENSGDYTKCTFFGPETPDFDTATDDELRSLFGI